MLENVDEHRFGVYEFLFRLHAFFNVGLEGFRPDFDVRFGDVFLSLDDQAFKCCYDGVEAGVGHVFAEGRFEVTPDFLAYYGIGEKQAETMAAVLLDSEMRDWTNDVFRKCFWDAVEEFKAKCREIDPDSFLDSDGEI